MKFFSSEHSFAYPWEHVSISNWKKYPNEMSTHVIAVDVLRREVNKETGILTTERLITCRQPIPRWMECITGSNVSYVREVSQVDPVQRSVVMRSENLTMNNMLSVYETVTYKPDVNDPAGTTIFTQEAQIQAFATFKRLCNKIEDWSVERFGHNAQLGRAGFESVLQKLRDLQDEHKAV